MWRRTILLVASLWLGLAVATMPAQAPQGGGGGRGGRGPAAGQTVEKIRLLKPNLYMITGGGANTLVRVTPEGVIVVDTKNPGDENYNRVMEEIKSVSTLPVKFVLNTHHHPDHVGNNQKFIDAGATGRRRSKRSRRAWPAIRARRTFPGCRRRRSRRTTC